MPPADLLLGRRFAFGDDRLLTMALGLARDQASDCTTPVLVFYAYARGFLRDVASLEFQVFDISTPARRLTPVQVYPVAPGRHAVNLDPCDDAGNRLGVGRYVAAYTPDAAEPLGDHLIRWFVTPEAGDAEVTYEQEFQVLPADEVVLPTMYCSISDLREEGLEQCGASDMRLFKAIIRASSMIDRITGRFFGPRYMVQRHNGRGGPYLLLGDPIIAVESVEINAFPLDTDPTQLLSVDALRVYNRHIADGLLNPDDRSNPKLEVYRGDDGMHAGDTMQPYFSDYASLYFPRGQQNVVVTGVFGYTEPDGSTVGKIPDDIRHVCALLTLRNTVQLTDEDRASQNFAFRISQERTKEQGVGYASPGGRAASMVYGYFTGDPEIDHILAAYMRPPSLGAV